MPKKKKHIPQKLQAWIDARKRFHLSHAQVQMARELGMNPKKLGKLVPSSKERWKLPLPAYIEKLYKKRFGKARPDNTMSIEQRSAEKARKKAEKREAKRKQRETTAEGSAVPNDPDFTSEQGDIEGDEYIPF